MAKSPSVKKKPAPRKPSAPPQAAAAFDKVLAEIEALSPDRLIPVNLDVPRVVSQVLGVSPGLRALRPAVAEHLPTFDVALLDRLETYALAAWYAHLLSLSSGDVENALKPLLAEAAPLRQNLLGDAEALARRGLLDAETVADIRAGQGYIDTANAPRPRWVVGIAPHKASHHLHRAHRRREVLDGLQLVPPAPRPPPPRGAGWIAAGVAAPGGRPRAERRGAPREARAAGARRPRAREELAVGAWRWRVRDCSVFAGASFMCLLRDRGEPRLSIVDERSVDFLLEGAHLTAPLRRRA